MSFTRSARIETVASCFACEEPEIARAIGAKQVSIRMRIFAFFMSITFGAFGLFIFHSEFLNPLLESNNAKNWVQLEARVLKSELLNNDGSTHIELKYRYSYKGRTHTGDRFDLSKTGRNFNTDTFKETIINYPKGKLIPIWVNPNQPDQSVYNRSMVSTNWIGLPFSLLFIFAGGCGLAFAIFNGYALRSQTSARKDTAKIAAFHSAREIEQALLDQHFEKKEYSRLSFLKHDHFINTLGYLSLLLILICFIGVFGIASISLHKDDTPLVYAFTFFSIIMAVMLFHLTRNFMRSLLNGKGEDYVILSKWDEEFKEITHHWLLLSQKPIQMEVSLNTLTYKHAVGALKKALRNTTVVDSFKTPDQKIIQGSITHTIEGSRKKILSLIFQTKNISTGELNKHNLTLRVADD